MNELIFNPNIGYLLLTFGMLAAFLAIVTPGTGFLEAAALTMLLLAGFQMLSLPLNLWALVILVLAVPAFLQTVRLRGDRRYLLASLMLLLLGAAWLYQGDSFWPAVNPVLILAVSLVIGGFLWLAVPRTLAAMLAPPHQDINNLLGKTGEARTEIYRDGTVQVAGEEWSAYSEVVIPAGERIRVTGRQGFILEVEPLASEVQ